MIPYLDSSVLPRVYLADEYGHEQAKQLLNAAQIATVTGPWTRIEISGTLIHAARSCRGDAERLLALLDEDLSPDGPVIGVNPRQDQVAWRRRSAAV